MGVITGKTEREKTSDIRKWWIIFEPTTAIQQLDHNLYISQQTNTDEKKHEKTVHQKRLYNIQPDLSSQSESRELKKN